MFVVSWDKYAPYYDWENAPTMGRRDVAFWKQFASKRGRGLELGCGTGRLLLPLARAGVSLVGIDLSSGMLARARERLRRVTRGRRPRLVRGDIRTMPFPASQFAYAFAPYGVLQSLTSDEDFDATLVETARVLKPGGRFGFELVPDLPNWDAYQRQVRFEGRLGASRVTLVESVRQDRRRGVTIFDEEFSTRTGRKVRHDRFSLTFRTLAMPVVLSRLGQAGLTIEKVYGDYRGGAWTDEAHVWIVMARR
jgi:ubiquinone/menaquinone biosynthesis C-methylase UbiE